MLISLRHRFIFVANIKAASTAIERALGGLCEVSVNRTSFGKHMGLHALERRFAGLFEIMPRKEFRVFGVVRDPVDWLFSLYRSHKSVHFEGTELDATNLTFKQFLSMMREQASPQLRPQTSYFEDISGRFGLDFLIRFDNLQEDFSKFLYSVGVEDIRLTYENVSIDMDRLHSTTEATETEIYSEYAVDDYVLQNTTGRWIEDRERDLITSLTDQHDAHLIDYRRAVRRTPLAVAHRPITRDDVIWAYRMLLSRDPESEAAISHHLQLGTRQALRARLMDSDEFRSQQQQS